jgi:hypothetical protein
MVKVSYTSPTDLNVLVLPMFSRAPNAQTQQAPTPPTHNTVSPSHNKTINCRIEVSKPMHVTEV